MTADEEIFVCQCDELGEKIISVTLKYPKPIVMCVLPGVLASLMSALDLPRETVVAMIDSALEDMQNAE